MSRARHNGQQKAASHSGSQTTLAVDLLLGVPLFLGYLGMEDLHL